MAGNELVMGSLKSEAKELKLSEIDLHSIKHSPTKDSQKIKLDRVINSLLPELEELEAEV